MVDQPPVQRLLQFYNLWFLSELWTAVELDSAISITRIRIILLAISFYPFRIRLRVNMIEPIADSEVTIGCW